MEGDGAPLTPNIPCFFSPPLEEPSPQPHLSCHSQPQQSHLDCSSAADIIDWVALLSGQVGFLDQKPNPESDLETLLLRVSEQGMGATSKEKGRMSGTKKASRPRFAFQTRSADDILDDGYRWRKYGQKAVKNSIYPRLCSHLSACFLLIASSKFNGRRSYYRCTHHTCNVKKQVQRLSKDTSIVVTTYEGIHNHPCEKLMETLNPLLKQMQFLARF